MPFLLLLLLLLATGYLLPVTFSLHFSYNEEGFRLSLSMAALHGLFRREHSFLDPSGPAGMVNGRHTGRSPVHQEQEKKEGRVEIAGLWSRLQEARQRFQYFGLGGTFLSYFIPARYLPWFHVAGDLEKRGRFLKLDWRTRVGLEEAAATAWAVGMLWAVKGMLLARVDRHYRLSRPAVKIKIEPSFQKPALATTFNCIFSLRVGQIILASLRGFVLDKWRRGETKDAQRAPDRGSHENGNAEHQRDG